MAIEVLEGQGIHADQVRLLFTVRLGPHQHGVTPQEERQVLAGIAGVAVWRVVVGTQANVVEDAVPVRVRLDAVDRPGDGAAASDAHEAGQR